mgnify:CR=1 FL=1
MKLEVGMYVKTRYGHIDKIKNIDVDWYCLDCDDIETPHKVYQLNNFYYDDNFDEVNDWVSETFIINASYSIIDLIEVGDYVNGYYVEDVLKTFVNVAVGSNYFQSPTIYEKDIKSIVTKEQFENMKYGIAKK